MKFKHHDIEIPEETPFLNCKLRREENAEVLTSIIGNYADGFVLALNSQWGTGKTTFVKMWNQHLINNGYKTMYFNAWENDFDSEPMVAILAELKTLIGDSDNAIFKTVLEKGMTLTKTLLPAIAKAIADKYIDSETVLDVIKDGIGGATELLEAEVIGYTKKKQKLIEFKKELEKYVIEQGNGKPVVLIIDELDRCRPDYAVEVLENVKHFFSVPGFVFVLSIDKVQLANSVRGYYGSELIDGDEYLRRFIDIEYRLPEPNYSDYLVHLYNSYTFEDFFDAFERNHTELKRDKEDFIWFSSELFRNKTLSLRQQEKIFSHARVSLKCFDKRSYLFPTVFVLIIFIREHNVVLYEKIKNQKLSIQEFADEIEVILFSGFENNTSDNYKNLVLITEALLLITYSKSFENGYLNRLYFTPAEDGKEVQLKFNSKSKEFGEDKRLIELIDFFRRKHTHSIKMEYFFNKIDLLENIKL